MHLLVTLIVVDGGLHHRPVCRPLIRVDVFAELLPIEEVLKEPLDLGDLGGTTNKDRLVDLPHV